VVNHFSSDAPTYVLWKTLRDQNRDDHNRCGPDAYVAKKTRPVAADV